MFLSVDFQNSLLGLVQRWVRADQTDVQQSHDFDSCQVELKGGLPDGKKDMDLDFLFPGLVCLTQDDPFP